MKVRYTGEQYVDDVLAGRQIACKWVRLACERHRRDMSTGAERGLWFDERAAKRATAFFPLVLRHSKGKWSRTPVYLEPWQQFIVGSLFGWKRDNGTRRYRTGYVECARKAGKSTLVSGIGLYLLTVDNEPGAEVYNAAPLALDTEIPTPTGWVTMGDICVGDWVFDETGHPCRVTYVSPVMFDRECYDVVFDDGTVIVADADHRWQTGVYSSGRSLKGRNRDEFSNTRSGARTQSIYTTAEIKETLLYRGLKNHRIPIAGVLDLPEISLPIGPYTLGVWLGDGRNNGGQIAFHHDDVKIADGIKDEGYEISLHGDGRLLMFTVLGLRTGLRLFDVLNNKHIPPIYLRSSAAQRMALLRGLMDTDGTCTTSGECRFTNRKKQLAEDVVELLCTLGFKPHLREETVTGDPHYVVSFKAYADTPVFTLQRKASRQKTKPDPRAQNRYIAEVNRVLSVPVRCIGVDSPSSLYLVTRRFVATHNTKIEQARIVHQEAIRMVRQSPLLLRDLRIAKNNIHNPVTFSKFEPLGSNSETLDGLNVHGGLVDEVHAHPDSGVWDVLQTGMGARMQPLMIGITTAGFNPHGFGYTLHDYTEKVLDGTFTDDSWFGVIYTLDRDPETGQIEDWENEAHWVKANPNLGVSKFLDVMRDGARRAKSQASAVNNFLTKELNVWTTTTERAINTEQWRLCSFGRVDSAGLRGRKCWVAVDLSSTTDVTAEVLVFEPDEQGVRPVVCRFWIPGDNVWDRVRSDRVPFDVWARDGYVDVTPGNVIDDAYILEQIKGDLAQFDVQEVAYDPWNATWLANQLQAAGMGADRLIAFRQGYVSMNPAMDQLQKAIGRREFNHQGNPVLTWMAGNLVFARDPAGNKKPDKGRASERIDGIVALAMALYRSVLAVDIGSVYDERGILSV